MPASPEGRFLRLGDRRTGEPIPTRPERIAFYQARLAEQQARVVEQEARLAEQEAALARLQALLRKNGIDPEARDR